MSSFSRPQGSLYLAILADFNPRYGGTLFYEYHKSFSAKSFTTLFNTRLDWAVTDSELLVRHFGGQRALFSACVLCSSHGHSAAFCPKGFATWESAAIHGSDPAHAAFDVKGRPIIAFNGTPLCNNFNESVCNYAKCKFSHICSFCRDLHPKSVCPRRFRPASRGRAAPQKKF